MDSELLTTEELSLRIKYDVRMIRERLKDGKECLNSNVDQLAL